MSLGVSGWIWPGAVNIGDYIVLWYLSDSKKKKKIVYYEKCIYLTKTPGLCRSLKY